jgi:hypothetical protein
MKTIRTENKAVTNYVGKLGNGQVRFLSSNQGYEVSHELNATNELKSEYFSSKELAKRRMGFLIDGIASIKLGQSIEITYQEAKKLLKKQAGYYKFKSLNESTISETVNFECVQNRKYFIEKVGKKGTVLYKDTEFEEKAKIGLFEVEMTWDYRHPSNFCQNKNNLNDKFKAIF